MHLWGPQRLGRKGVWQFGGGGVMLLNLALDSCLRCLWASMWVDEIQTRAEVWVWDMDDCLTCAQGFPAIYFVLTVML